MKAIRIVSGQVEMKAELYDTPTGKAVSGILPVEGRVSRWGDEIYFPIPLELKEEPDARADVSVGDLGYWPVGRAFCIFFGPTPVSTDDRPHAASAVNVFGKIIGDASRLKAILPGATLCIRSLGDIP